MIQVHPNLMVPDLGSLHKDQTNQFYSCTMHLREHPETRNKFHGLSDNKQTTTWKNWYEYLRNWLPKADAASRLASGTHETDQKLWELIQMFFNQEEGKSEDKEGQPRRAKSSLQLVRKGLQERLDGDEDAAQMIKVTLTSSGKPNKPMRSP
ncbi:hypothetical protein DFH28DRAFT_932432 [Melampsora americana]|nr:hypothetical protein DFH28DRAFT_932432 [Melampsora americana]